MELMDIANHVFGLYKKFHRRYTKTEYEAWVTGYLDCLLLEKKIDDNSYDALKARLFADFS